MIEVILEIILQIFLELCVWIGPPYSEEMMSSPTLSFFNFLVFGIIFGVISFWIYPHTIIKNHDIRFLSLFVTPILCGISLTFFNSWKLKEKYKFHFGLFINGFIFSLIFSLIRFYGIK